MLDERSQEDLSLEKHFMVLIRTKNFCMANAGMRTRGGILTNEPCVVVGVSEKVPLCELTDEERIPSALPDGTPIDVVEMQKIDAQGENI